MILNNEKKYRKLLEIAKDPYSNQRVDGRLDISNMDLMFEDFNRSSFYGVDFNNVCFTGAHIRDSFFHACTFTNCQMTSVNFLETQIVSCKFIDCELSKIAAAFNECDLSSVNFINCNMDYVKFCFAFLNNVFTSGCSLKCADFGRAKLEKAMFVRCNMSEAVFDEAQFDEAEFKESDLTKLSAKHIVLKGRVSAMIDSCNHEGMVMTTNRIHFINNCEVTKIWPEG